MGVTLNPDRNVPRDPPWGAMDLLGWLPEQVLQLAAWAGTRRRMGMEH